MTHDIAWRTAALALIAGTATVTIAADGPDVITSQMQSATTLSSDDPGGTGDRIWACAVGGDTCNIGDEAMDTLSYTNRHPILHQSMYRLKNGRFEEIGLSWVKHTFYTKNMEGCGIPCSGPSDGSTLNSGCRDPRDASHNGMQTFMGPMWQVNAFTGYFPWPTNVPTVALQFVCKRGWG